MLPGSREGKFFPLCFWHKTLVSSFAFAQTFPTANAILRAVNWEKFQVFTLLGRLSCKFGL